MKWLRRGLAALALLGFFLAVAGYAGATRDPVVRRASVALAHWPHAKPPLHLLLLSDIHVAGPDMPPQRLERLVGRMNALRPDLILIAGDFISERRLATRIYTPREAAAPLAGFTAPLGVAAVLGNHDNRAGAEAMKAALEDAGITVLENEALRVGGLTIGGVGDEFSGHADIPATLDAIQKAGESPRPTLILTHSPDIVPDLPEDIGLVLAGHTHCGQVRLPLIGPVSTMSRYGNRYACGHIVEDGRHVIVGAGLGTSIAPMRIGAPPDMWLITISGEARDR